MTAPGNQASYKASMINQLESARDKYIADANNLIDLLKVDTFVDNVVSTDTISGFAYPVDNNKRLKQCYTKWKAIYLFAKENSKLKPIHVILII